MVQETEEFQDEDEINELKCEVEHGLEKFRVTHLPREAHKSSKAVTNADENMVRIPSTDNSDVKLNVARYLEPWSSIVFTSFLG